MSRSRRRTPICGITTARSEKSDKRIWHRRARARIHVMLFRAAPDDIPHLDIREVSNPWSMAKDGRQWFGDPLSWRQGTRWEAIRAKLWRK